jgi:hypothetical protein
MTTNNRPPGHYDREDEWHRMSPVERFEWLEDHCWPRRDLTITPPKLSDEDRLREAIDLGVKMAEADALLMLTRKARQVRATEIERRRPHLIVNNTLH